MLCLGFSTSTDAGSIALLKKDKIIAQTSWTRGSGGSEVVTPKIQALLKRAKVKATDLDLIAVDKGPGSFTGCRIAVNVAKTFSFTLGIPLFAASSLEIMAAGYREKFPKSPIVTCCLDAHKSLYYFEIFAPDQNSKPQALGREAIVSLLKDISTQIIWLGLVPENISDSLPQLKIISTANLKVPRAKTLVQLARKAAPEEYSTWAVVEPTYIRVPDAVEKLLAKSLK